MDFFLNMYDVNNPYRVEWDENAMDGPQWPKSMDAMIAKRCASGPQGDHLEINAHGLPGFIAVEPWVTLANLPSFTDRLRRLMRPNGFIEVLSCFVAGLSGKGLLDLLLNSNDEAEIARFNRESHQGSKKTQLSPETVLTVMRRAIEMGPISPAEFANAPPAAAAKPGPAAAGGGGSRSLVFDAPPPGPAGAAPDLAMRSLVSSTGSAPPKPHTKRPPRWTPPASITQQRMDARNANGPYFCAKLAELSRCRIRAASYKQLERGEDSGNQWFNTPFGSWEGHVMDFLPTGQVRYVGFNPARPVYKTHDRYGDGPMRLG